MKIKHYGNVFNVNLLISSYSSNGNMAIEIMCDDGEAFDSLTTNLDFLTPFYAFVKEDKILKDFIKEYKLGKPTGTTRISGYNTYLLYEFDAEELRKYASRDSDYLYLGL